MNIFFTRERKFQYSQIIKIIIKKIALKSLCSTESLPKPV